MMCSRFRGLGRTTIARKAGDNICQMAEKRAMRCQPSPRLVAACLRVEDQPVHVEAFAEAMGPT